MIYDWVKACSSFRAWNNPGQARNEMTNPVKDRALEIFVDGACSGNPGEAGIGVVINSDGKTLKKI